MTLKRCGKIAPTKHIITMAEKAILSKQKSKSGAVKKNSVNQFVPKMSLSSIANDIKENRQETSHFRF